MKADDDRFKILKFDNGLEYIIDKRIIGFAMLAVTIVMVLIIAVMGFDKLNPRFYVSCDTTHGTWNSYSGSCKNPLYQEWEYCDKAWSTACSDEWLPNGFVYGEEPPHNVIAGFELIVYSTFFIAFVSNHFRYNRGKFKEGFK